MENVQLFGITLAPVILATVQLLKMWGLPSRFAPIAALILSVFGVWLVEYVAVGPGNVEFIEWALTMLVSFLGSMGLYDGGKWAVKTRLGTREKVGV